MRQFDHLQFLLLICLCFLFLTLIHDVQDNSSLDMLVNADPRYQNIAPIMPNKLSKRNQGTPNQKLPLADEIFQLGYPLSEEESDELYLGCDTG